MSLHCELSGEMLASSSDEAVVTPSGHICLKRMLLTKLTENGGMDPFEEGRPLTEDQLITLKTTAKSNGSSISTKIVPPRTNASTSMPGLLTALQKEYDALVLELFDARKALEETRRELSQALYQNDAAMRVVARVAMERDQARQQLEEYYKGRHHHHQPMAAAGGSGSGSGIQEASDAAATAVIINNSNSNSNKNHNMEVGGEEAGESLYKKRKLDQVLPLSNDIPVQDLESMIAAWEPLHQGRKAQQKQAATTAPKPEQVASYHKTESIQTESWHSTKCKGITAFVSHGDMLLSAGKDKSLVIYNTLTQQVVVSLTVGDGSDGSSKAATCVDMSDTLVAAGLSNGKVHVWTLQDGSAVGTPVDLLEGAVVSVSVHPDQKHILAATESGAVCLVRIDESNELTLVSVFKSKDKDSIAQYTSGCLHPDGLIYVAGTHAGEILLWDLKSRSLASTLKDDHAFAGNVVSSIHVSNNGYHIAAAYASSNTVAVWDMRKQKCIATLNRGPSDGAGGDDNALLEEVAAVAFDAAGKYLAFSGKGGAAKVVMVKEWEKITATLPSSSTDDKGSSSIVWGSKGWIATSSVSHAKVSFFGMPLQESA